MSQELFQEARSIDQIPSAPLYFPPETGRYEVKPGLMPLDTDFGNGALDRQVFQIDAEFEHYRAIKCLARSDPARYYQTWNLTKAVEQAVVQMMLDRLRYEYPQHFQSQSTPAGAVRLHCHLTGETLEFTGNRLQNQSKYASAIDALAAQVQEDVAVVSRSPTGTHWVSAIHLCFPNYWSAEDKIGKDFAIVHAPVAGMAAINSKGAAIVQTMITRRPMVRFGWGIATDARLNHHPLPPVGVTAEAWQGRQFDRTQPRLFVRVERQVIWGLPDQDALLFLIRTYFWDCQQINRDRREKLRAAIASMSPASLVYKGLEQSRDEILAWLALP